VFIAACSPARASSHENCYIAYGHSSVVSPWGEVISKAGFNDEIIFADLDFSQVDTVRSGIPCWTQKRNDVYMLNDLKNK
jgi:omega-amidase